MPSHASSQLIGHLVRDFELANTPSGTPVAKSAVAVNRKWKSAGGEKQEDVSFFDVEAWGKNAENLQRYTSKGDAIFLVCEPRQDRWQDKDGNNRNKVKFVVQQFQFLGNKQGGGQQQQAQAQPAAPEHPGFSDDDESIPFAPDCPEDW